MHVSKRVLFAIMLVALASCGGGGEPGRFAFEITLQGLPDLGAQSGHYEGWAVISGVALSTGKFVVDASFAPARVTSPAGNRIYGTVNGASFGPSNTGIGQGFPLITSASHFFITIEAEGDSDGLPSGTVVLAGRIMGDSAVLTFTGEIDTGVVANPDYSAVSGDAILVNATGGGVDANGVWFAPQPAGSMGLSLPVPAGAFEYEGWVIEQATGTRYSTGKFVVTDRFDFDAQTNPTRGTASIGLLAPGQDFVNAATVNASPGPLDLTDGTWRVVLTVEPCADNSADPFPLRLLDADIPTDAIDMNGLAGMDVMLDSQFTNLPELDAMASAGLLTLTGQAPGELGPATAGLYALWACVGGANELVARFVVDDTAMQVTSLDGMTVFGSTSSFSFDPTNTGLTFPAVETATGFFITLEPQGDPEAGPSEHVVLDGVVTPGKTTLSVAGAGLGIADFEMAAGSFVTMTPTDDAPGATANDGMGVWFRDLTLGTPSLALPALPAQWRYEAWVESTVGAGRFSLGRFSTPDRADEDAMTWPGRGPESTGFNVPGQDFIVLDPGQSIPAGLDLTTGFDVEITLEPFPDSSLAPSSLVVLSGPLPNATGVPSAPLVNGTGNFATGTLSY